jgi:ATP-binding cassette subfamily C (CFTR/MRP) protein 4
VIFSETIKNNILFGREFSTDLYQRVIEQSCLISDFEILDKGDETLVGERGITLSGGQKARVSLARALYAEADIYLFDDPISAVDSKVARKIQ